MPTTMGRMMKIYRNLKDAIRSGNAQAPCGIGYKKDDGWFVYELADGMLIKDAVPEFVCVKHGTPPIPLNDMALDAWTSLVKATLN